MSHSTADTHKRVPVLFMHINLVEQLQEKLDQIRFVETNTNGTVGYQLNLWWNNR